MTNINAINQDTNLFLKQANNLSDVANTTTSIQNLGIATGTDQPVLLGDQVLTNPPPYLTIYTPLGAGQKLKLPPTTGTQSLQEGSQLLIVNGSSTDSFQIVNDVDTFGYATLNPGEAYFVYLLSKINPPFWVALPADTQTTGSPRQLIYVSANGSDITGTGTIEKPFATVSFALTQITDNGFTKQYTIMCSSSLINETNLALKPFVNINLQNATLNCSGNITLDPSWNFVSLNQVSCYINNGIIQAASINLDMSIFPSNKVLFTFFDVAFNTTPTITLTGNNSTNFQIFSFTNCGDINMATTFNLNNVESQFSDCIIFNLNVNQTLNSNNHVFNSLFLTGNLVLNSIPASTTSNFVFGTVTFNPISINGAGSQLFIDSSSFISIPIGTNPTNYTIVSLSNGVNANYAPVNYSVTGPSVHEHLVGIDNALTPSIVNITPDNVIIGGDFSSNPWQRGTNFPAITTGGYTADRFVYFQTGFGTVDIVKQADAPTFVQAGIATNDSLKLTVALADVVGPITFYGESYFIEGFDWARISQNPFTFSFWVKSSQAGTYCIAFQNGAQDRSYVVEYVINAPNTWEFKTMNVTAAPIAGTWNYTNQRGLGIVFTLTAGAALQTGTPNTWVVGNAEATAAQTQWITTLANTFQIALVQLTSGTATYPFIYQNQADVIDRCQRYYEKSYNLDVAPTTNTTIGSFNFSNSSAVAGDIDFDVRYATKKRAIPNNIFLYSIAGNISNITQNDGSLIAAVTAGIGESSFRVQATNDPLKYGGAGHYICDAEL